MDGAPVWPPHELSRWLCGACGRDMRIEPHLIPSACPHCRAPGMMAKDDDWLIRKSD
jgi:ribosomal protein S27AE